MTYGVIQGVLACLAFFVIPVLTRVLTVDGFALYSWVLSMAGLYSAVTTSWISAAIIRFPPNSNYNIIYYYLKLFLISNTIGILCAVTALKMSSIVESSLIWPSIFICLNLSLFTFLSAIIRSVDSAILFGSFNITRYLAFLLPAVTLVFLDGDMLVAAMILLAVSYLTPVVLHIKVFKNVLLEFRQSKSISVGNDEVLKYGYPVLINGTLILSLPFLTKYFYMQLEGINSLGIFSANFDFGEKSFAMVNIIWSLAINPAIFRKFDSNPSSTKNALSTSLTTYLYVTMPLLAIVYAYRDFLSLHLFSSAFIAGSHYLVLGGLNAFVLGLIHRFAIVLSMHKKTHFILFSLIIAFSSFILFNIVNIWHHLNVDVGFILLLATLIQLIFTVIMSKRFLLFKFKIRWPAFALILVILQILLAEILVDLLGGTFGALVIAVLLYFMSLLFYFLKARLEF